ncbi:MAG: PilT/PilU family type 4a pilus ATPase [Candidatus Eisenbacteria bacterium]|nr:PilT/PilU family type 4a pilus ATPase [Candidatus Latescibacterota bacterium]MBD3302695.1 PilT/PilU family type 4a pilus ATPase [Candidatus Eisenbacteria bacterium]
MNVVDILHEAVRLEASDVILSAGAPITYHVHGRLVTGSRDRTLTDKESETLAYQLLRPDQKKTFETEKELDLSFHLKDVARFRVSVYRQRGTVAAVLRIVPLVIPHYRAIGIQETLLLKLLNTPSGLILVTGPTGAGKSTTVASLLDHLNTDWSTPRHIITIEDPIEFLLDSRVCVIDQRELGPDTKSYVAGLRSALRQMPHIIFVGEMRDRETMEVALTAAETGNLVISTLSTQSAARTINRVIDVFPLQDQVEIRARLALTLKAVISQVLLPRQDVSGRVAAREIMFVTGSIANLIREGKIHQINNVMAGSFSDGMVLMDDSLMQLQRDGVVSLGDVLPRLQDKQRTRELMKSA